MGRLAEKVLTTHIRELEIWSRLIDVNNPDHCIRNNFQVKNFSSWMDNFLDWGHSLADRRLAQVGRKVVRNAKTHPCQYLDILILMIGVFSPWFLKDRYHRLQCTQNIFDCFLRPWKIFISSYRSFMIQRPRYSRIIKKIKDQLDDKSWSWRWRDEEVNNT